MQAPPVLIEGVRVRLRRAVADDAAALFAMVDDDEVMRFMEWPRSDRVDDTRAHLEAAALRWAAGTEHQYLVLAKDDGAAVGSVSFRPRGHAADFGYLLGRPHWGRGLAREASALLLGWLQRQPQLQRVWATCDVDNSRSAAVLRALGLQQEGLLRKATVRPNMGPLVGQTPRDTLLFAWVREETAP